MFWASQRGGHRSGLSSRPHSEVLWDFQTVLLLLSLQVSEAFKRCPEMPRAGWLPCSSEVTHTTWGAVSWVFLGREPFSLISTRTEPVDNYTECRP